MSKEQFVKMDCVECGRINYHMHKNRKVVQTKLEFSKFCDNCRKHTSHKERKK